MDIIDIVWWKHIKYSLRWRHGHQSAFRRDEQAMEGSQRLPKLNWHKNRIAAVKISPNGWPILVQLICIAFTVADTHKWSQQHLLSKLTRPLLLAFIFLLVAYGFLAIPRKQSTATVAIVVIIGQKKKNSMMVPGKGKKATKHFSIGCYFFFCRIIREVQNICNSCLELFCWSHKQNLLPNWKCQFYFL